jgi:hypothetical protein
MADNKHIKETVAHYLTGLIVIVKGFEKMEHFDEHPFIPIFLFALGAFIIIATLCHRFFEQHVKEFKTLLHGCEFLVLCLVAYYYFVEGKKALPAAYLIAAIGHLVAAIVFYRKKVSAIKKAANDH